MVGSNGLQGQQGVTGAPGSRGRRGNPGTNGVDGKGGEKGAKGDTVCVQDEGYTVTSTSCESLSNFKTGGGGLLYYRWGRTSCPTGGSSRIYSGELIGQDSASSLFQSFSHTFVSLLGMSPYDIPKLLSPSF